MHKDKSDVILDIAVNILNSNHAIAREIINCKYPHKHFVIEKRTYTMLQKMDQFVKDGFIDRYTGKKLLNPGMLKVISYYFPEEFPYQAHWKMTETHSAYWDLVPTIDHIYPIAQGGHDDEQNWVTTSMKNNSIKSNYTIEEIHWTLYPQGKFSDWDGLTSLFLEIVDRNIELLKDNYIKSWYNASKKIPIEKNSSGLVHSKKGVLRQFSEKALSSLNGYYVYALIDPRTEQVFYIGKGFENRVFAHEIESGKNAKSEKEKLKRIREIEKAGFEVKRVLINWGMTETEAFASEASLINLMQILSKDSLTNLVAGHHIHEALTVEEFEILHGAEQLRLEDIRHNIMIIKINKLYRRDMNAKELYDAVRGHWRASMSTIHRKNITYVFGVYNQLIVAVYKPDAWHYVHEMVDIPRAEAWDEETFNSVKNRIYFVCDDYENLDSEGQFYLHKSIAELRVNQSAQNPITYLEPLNSNELSE